MRLLATGRALRAASSSSTLRLASIPTRAHGTGLATAPTAIVASGGSRGYSLQSLRGAYQYGINSRRWNSSASAAPAATSCSPSIAENKKTTSNYVPFAKRAQETITSSAGTYTSDSFTNVPNNIFTHIGRQLYLQPNHPLAITRALIESQFPSPEYGNYIEPEPIVSVKDNFDDLGFPADHPGRAKTDTYYLNKGHVLRTHTSAHQMNYFKRMAENEVSKPEEKGYTVVADVYRRDAIDRSHYPVFHQMEAARLWKRLGASNVTTAEIWKDVGRIPGHEVYVEDPNPTIHETRNPLQGEYHTAEEVEAMAAHLKKSLENMVIEIFTAAKTARVAADPSSTKDEEPLKVRWVEAYFPFTSPSWELEVFYQGDWLEVLGCGIVKQEILINAGVPDRIGWALGIGIERIAMLLFNIPDIRLFWSEDQRFLNQFQAGKVTRFLPFSKQPVCYKDVAFWIPSEDASGTQSFHENDIMEIVRDIGGKQVEDVQLIDQFTHPKTGRKSCCYRINYRDLERTLTNEEVNEMHECVRQKLVEKCGVQLR
ncbi:Phenylalanyl-tRNA synthetase, class IIc, mitochondrial [Ascosphaera apis ARSEF 7405]|uniref:Phenylalanine--tRNA ligase, mitochondrial n=1 Tax=Ascosphaera apis ARSEF 7405 TaxID=392613 RepID=A0A168BDS1_9EURO|nr:Phenylalanyl-tRNA synthetase, class IIc, mitochondrial [Ascosphaera apis ARSEF 7405]